MGVDDLVVVGRTGEAGRRTRGATPGVEAPGNEAPRRPPRLILGGSVLEYEAGCGASGVRLGDCPPTYEELSATGVRFVMEPTKMPHGGTDAVFEDGCGPHQRAPGLDVHVPALGFFADAIIDVELIVADASPGSVPRRRVSQCVEG